MNATEETLASFLTSRACSRCAELARAWGVPEQEALAAAPGLSMELAQRFMGVVLALRDGTEVFEPEELEALIERNAATVAATTWPHRRPKGT